MQALHHRLDNLHLFTAAAMALRPTASVSQLSIAGVIALWWNNVAITFKPAMLCFIRERW